jgi:hypothetical protein
MIGLVLVYAYMIAMVAGISLAGRRKHESWGEWWRS